jgi:hypothetical protein
VFINKDSNFGPMLKIRDLNCGLVTVFKLRTHSREILTKAGCLTKAYPRTIDRLGRLTILYRPHKNVTKIEID